MSTDFFTFRKNLIQAKGKPSSMTTLSQHKSIVFCYSICMNKQKRNLIITFSSLYMVLLIAVIVLCCLKLFGYAILTIVPAPFLIPIFLTFYKVPKKTNRHAFLLILSIIGRYLLDTLAILIPALLWYYIPYLKENVASIFLLIPFFEVIFIYNIVAVLYIIQSKADIKRTNKKE